MPFPDDQALPAAAEWPDSDQGGSGNGTSARPACARPACTRAPDSSAGGDRLPSPSSNAATGRDGRLPPKTPRVLHLDVDAFLASVEQALHPKLRGLPVIVGGLPHERNLVMSCSYEARALGVRPGMRLAEAARLCPRGVFRRGDSQAAATVRARIAELLAALSPRVEVASIDDFFVDLAGTARAIGPAFEAAERARARIRAEVEVPVTIGIATTKSLARIAGKLAKPGGIAEILPGHERAFLHHLPLEHLPGAGGRLGTELLRLGLRTAGDLALVPREVLWTTFGHAGLALQSRALGHDDDQVEPSWSFLTDGTRVERPPRTLRRDSTFEPEEGRREIVEAMLAYLTERAAHRLREWRVVARGLVVRLQHVDTRLRGGHADDAHNLAEARTKLSPPSSSTDALSRHAMALLRSLPRRRALVKRVGLELTGLERQHARQGLLFDPNPLDAPTEPAAQTNSPAPEGGVAREERQRRLDEALDRLRRRHGFGGVLRGSSWLLAEGRERTRDGFVLRTPSLNQ
jgi:DNA polymerase-4